MGVRRDGVHKVPGLAFGSAKICEHSDSSSAGLKCRQARSDPSDRRAETSAGRQSLGTAGRGMGRRENGRRVPSVVCYECRSRSLEDVKL